MHGNFVTCNALPLGDNLLKRHFNIIGECPFGCQVIEIDMHLFKHCEFAKAAWFRSQLSLQTEVFNHTSMSSWFEYFQRKDKILCHRNKTFFEHKQVKPQDAIHVANFALSQSISSVYLQDLQSHRKSPFPASAHEYCSKTFG